MRPRVTNQSLSSRFDPAIVARIDELVLAIGAAEADRGSVLDRGRVLHRLVLLGLPILEAKYGLGSTKQATKNRGGRG